MANPKLRTKHNLRCLRGGFCTTEVYPPGIGGRRTVLGLRTRGIAEQKLLLVAVDAAKGHCLRGRRSGDWFAMDMHTPAGKQYGFLVAGKIDVGKDQQRLPAIGDVKSAVEVLDATFLEAGFVEGVGEGYGLLIGFHRSILRADGYGSDTAHFLACAIAWAFAPLTASRNGTAAAGVATRPSSVALVVTLGPYMARLERLSARIKAPLNVNPTKAPLARE